MNTVTEVEAGSVADLAEIVTISAQLADRIAVAGEKTTVKAEAWFLAAAGDHAVAMGKAAQDCLEMRIQGRVEQ